MLNINQKKYTLIAMFIMLATLSACSIMQDWFTRRANINLKSAHYLNPDINGEASPVVVTLYQLKNQQRFQQAIYTQLIADPVAVLQEDLIDKRTFQVRPDESTSMSVELSDHANYLGIAAAYSNINHAKWQQIIPLEAKSTSRIGLFLETQGIKVKRQPTGEGHDKK
jgi:type VI secretion system protein VasD